MKLNTLIKVGSLAFNVAQDEKVRELFKIAHKGAKRRGLFSPAPPVVPAETHGPRIPFAHGYNAHWPIGRW